MGIQWPMTRCPCASSHPACSMLKLYWPQAGCVLLGPEWVCSLGLVTGL